MSLFKHQTESIGLFLVHLNGRHIMYIYLLQIADCAVADGNTQEMRSSYKLHRANPDSTWMDANHSDDHIQSLKQKMRCLVNKCVENKNKNTLDSTQLKI